jgi:hypothetical protein
MWISQTYLGTVSPESNVYLYYFFEDYARQPDVPAPILRMLGDLGYSFGDRVSAFAPMNDYRGHIKQEMEERFREFWWTFREKTPGIFLCRKPLNNFNPSTDEWLYFPITKETINDDRAAREFFQKLHRICVEIIEHRYPPDHNSKRSSILEAIYDAAQLKLTFMGAGVDLKPLISRVLQKGGSQAPANRNHA